MKKTLALFIIQIFFIKISFSQVMYEIKDPNDIRISNKFDTLSKEGIRFVLKDKVPANFKTISFWENLNNGTYFIYYDSTYSDRVACVYNFKDSMLNGEALWYYPDGHLKAYYKYLNDSLIDNNFEFYENGNIKLLINVEGKKINFKEYDNMGYLLSEKIIKGNLHNLIFFKKWRKRRSGKLKLIFFYENDSLKKGKW